MKAVYSHSGQSSALLSDSTANTLNHTIAGWFRRVAQWLAPQLPAPRIYQHMDRSGQIYWSGFNPNTGLSIRWVSEAEIRVWLEQQYR
ncbi:hypothetical protein H6G89_06070 [Oscillatoria sp. FACHB-1407]|uniref:hypothetical protein n=1 Tax=Oscillatoria sp. FACHB-1407 TaxID=2692847 RepID=UPI001683CFFC|nr:hypothetical protein [Oscillatoria sp. FACHB-1407]MBD2460606.1 hypothetical protein [Oscillatoria sp. FACHB-1407]